MNDRSEFKVLVDQARTGDRDAMDRLIRDHSEAIMGLIRARLGSRLRSKLESMDIFQTAMKSAFRSIEKFEGETPEAFTGWLSRILVNDIRDKADFFGKLKRDFNHEESLDCGTPGRTDRAIALPGPNPTPSRQVMAGEEERLMAEALAQLPETMREVATLRRDGKSLAEIAGELGVGERTVSRLYAKALIEMRKYLEKKGYGGSERT